jgi:hypothetical protein
MGLAIGTALGLNAAEPVKVWDNFADTWVATDGLGRSLPTCRETGLPRAGRTVGMFYFLWHGEHGQQGPFDVSRILAEHPDGLTNPKTPWGPMYAMHHWGEPLFGYYLSDDESVIRKHAQMLADAGVDVVIFDVTNGWTYPKSYLALMRAFAEVRANGGRTPQIAFLCPFRNPPPDSPRGKVVQRLWEDVYKPGLHPELWFRWEGKPLLLTDPDNLRGERRGVLGHTYPAPLEPGHTLGQRFSVAQPFFAVDACFPTWGTTNASVTLALRRDGPAGACLAQRRFERIADNARLELAFDPPLPAGAYYLEASEAHGKVGWWGNRTNTFANGAAYADGQPAAGDREFAFSIPDAAREEIRSFFTVRDPEPSYFRGPSAPNQWSWLEVYPQHVFANARGEREMMAVGVAQNAVGKRLGAMSEPDSMGRSYHGGAFDRTPGAVDRGLNFAEQWERALQEDPQFVFVTGWNEWIASRFSDFCGVKGVAVFPDECDQEHSRDIEPMKGGHGDNYYYQLVAAVRQFKGVRPIPAVRSRPIQIDGRFDDWREVTPEFRDDIGDPVRRDHPGWGKAGRYVNRTGRNDIVAAKVSADATNVFFYVRTREPITLCSDPNWMLLFIDADQNSTNGWLGYDVVVNRSGAGAQKTQAERHQGSGYHWGAPVGVDCRVAGNELELSFPLAALGCVRLPTALDFKWADNIPQTGDWSDFTLNGDAAPNDRFNYRACFRAGDGESRAE